MSDHKLGPALATASTLRNAEIAISMAVSEAASLAKRLPETMMEMGLSPVIVRTAIATSGELVSTMCTALKQVADVHRQLEIISDSLGLPVVAIGDKAGISNGAAELPQRLNA